MRNAFFLVCLLLALPVSAEIYRWVDEEGVVHYSDTPRQNAEKVELPEPSVIPAPTPVQPRTTQNKDNGQQDSGTAYEVVTLSSPRPDETYQQGSTTIAVSVKTHPALQVANGHRIRILVDGQPVTSGLQTTSTSIPAPPRGTHRIAAEVLANGKRLAMSEQVSIHVLSPSVAEPANAAPGAGNVNRAPTAPNSVPTTGPAFGQ